ncbi:hypothetical protein P7C70_g7013, partial [Phenoliferia sp. Uapishka_3]
MAESVNRAHGRTASNSFRIAISSSSSLPSRQYPDSPRKPRQRTPSGTPLSPDMWSNLRSWFLGRRGSRSASKPWTIFAAVATVIILWSWFGGSGSGEGWFGRRKKVVDSEEIPTVDRSALEKLRLLEIHYGADEDDLAGDSSARRPVVPLRPQDYDAPPVVAAIPDVLRADPLAPTLRLSKVPADILDSEFCPFSTPCAFLLPAWLGEQETKAQMHLHQLGLLALSLNRTLVLPNVAKSRLSTCFANPFSFYYDEESLDKLGIPTISQAKFLEWSERRDPAPTAQVVSIVGAKATYTAGAIEIDSASDPTLVPNKPTRNLCLKAPRSRLNFAGHSPLAIYPPEGYHRSENGRLGFGESVVNTLSSPEVGRKSSRQSASLSAPYSQPNVLAFNYELRYPMMAPSVVSLFNPLSSPLPFSHFDYAPMWTDLAQNLADSLSPFIAIHWRTETLPPGNLVPCAASLLRKLALLKARYPEIRNVYLATDYPIEDPEGIAHSGTFAKVVTEQHHQAFRNFLKNFDRNTRGLKLTSFAKEQSRLELPEDLKRALGGGSSVDGVEAGPMGLEELDAGLMGIIDKAVAMRAEVFVSGFAGVGKEASLGCAKVSSFTGQILEARVDKLTQQGEGERGKGKLWNEVSRWSVKGVDDD